uniref:Uncharacterized protein n=1 Tax=Ciona savignyi TaxID=51511 RepID=H2ZE67_CIOSA
MDKKQLLHTTIYATAYSSCGTYLACGDNYGQIAVFNITEAVEAHSLKSTPYVVFQAHTGAIHALVTSGKYLISAGFGPINGWKWSDIRNKRPSKSFTLKDLQTNENESYNCVNYANKDSSIYTGADNGITYKWDINTLKCKGRFSGHTDYIHDLDTGSNTLITASEDGTVKLWDTRTATCTNTISPCKNKQLNRPEFGQWISSVALDESGEWLVCGGSAQPSLWHLRSKSMATVLETSDKSYTPNKLMFQDDEIISAGNKSIIYRWNVNGEKKAEIPCSINRVFSLSFKQLFGSVSNSLPLIASGNSYKLSLFTNLGYEGKLLSIV